MDYKFDDEFDKKQQQMLEQIAEQSRKFSKCELIIQLFHDAINLWEKKGYELMYTCEITTAIKHLAIYQYKYDAKNFLRKLDLHTDKDIYDLMQYFIIIKQLAEIKLPPEIEIPYYDIPIIESINESDIEAATQFVIF